MSPIDGGSPVPGWNIADVLEVVALEVPEQPAVIQGSVRVTWRELNARAESLGATLLDAGLGRQSKVALYLRNSPAYVESLVASLKVAMIPVNTNYRYSGAELTYLWDNADIEAVVFDSEFTPVVDRLRGDFPHIKLWLWRDDGSGSDRPAWATSYDDVVLSGRQLERTIERSGDDLILLYTGGTTGLPKGVMWRQDDIFVLLGNAANGGYGPEQDLEYARSRVVSPGRRLLPAAPLMHGAGVFSCIPVLVRGGAIVLLEGASFDPEQLLDAVAREHVHTVGWVGDAFAKPVLEALERHPGRWNLKSWRTITSGGVMFSQEVKQGLLRHAPQLLINDVFGASEAITVGSSITTKEGTSVPTGSFTPRPDMRVLRPDGTSVVPGSGEAGLMAFRGRQPLGYYKDEAKTAATFQIIGGERYSVPGDWAILESDGTATLLGRGSACINTGGEKVFAEEVEQVIARHPAVADVVVVGVPHERFGEVVTAVVQLEPGEMEDVASLEERSRIELAGYKVPKHWFFVPRVSRGPNGKADLQGIRELAMTLAADRIQSA
jgi:acyl-CoA synthetase (AMP-forming)/AMP-acid ligase II